METLPGGAQHTIIQLDGDSGPLANTGVFAVPPGDYFMMGDNRDDSLDSRVPVEQNGVGYVPFENMIGRAELLFFSVREGEPAWAVWAWPWSVRWDRMFHPIH
jgi:signal peptidase I